MSVVAMLQGTVETDLATIRTALSLARRMNVPMRALCALPDPNAALMVIATPEAAGLTSATTQSIFDMQEEVLAKAREAYQQPLRTKTRLPASSSTRSTRSNVQRPMRPPSRRQ